MNNEYKMPAANKQLGVSQATARWTGVTLQFYKIFERLLVLLTEVSHPLFSLITSRVLFYKTLKFSFLLCSAKQFFKTTI